MNDLKLKQYLSDQLKLLQYIKHVFNEPKEVGQFYERYIGYRYESLGYSVEYSGIIKGYEDLGRDLIAQKGNELLVIQCKKWSRSHPIHVKHVYQLYGTSVHLQKTLSRKVRPVFVSSGELTEEALSAARDLGVEVRFIDLKKDYPMVKCNINSKGKLYHLPFGKWYDSVHIDTRVGDRYVYSVEEAVNLGFCSAYLNRKKTA